MKLDKNTILLIGGAVALYAYKKGLLSKPIAGHGIGALDNYHIIFVKYIGPTNTKGARISLKSNSVYGGSKTIDFNYSDRNIAVTAENYLKDAGFDLIGQSETEKGYAIITNTFKSLK
jgi:hypothetical protein